MIKIDKKWIKLDAMGEAFGNDATYTPLAGNYCYDPNEKIIKKFKESGGTVVEEKSFSPIAGEVYYNVLTLVAYIWNGNDMIEVDRADGSACYENDTDFSIVKNVYHIFSCYSGEASPSTEQTIKENVTIPDGSTLVFHDNGCFVNCKIFGSRLQVVANGVAPRFKFCDFNNATFIGSSLYATNFGAMPDAQFVSDILNLGSLQNFSIKRRTGTNNDGPWKAICQFLSGSNQIKIEFNGNFYSDNYKCENIYNSDNIELYGGTLNCGFYLYDCCHISIHDINFVGKHGVHAFPKMDVNKPANNYNDERINMLKPVKLPDGSTSIVNAIRLCGLAGSAISAYRTRQCEHIVGDINIERCHFEMRQGGVVGHSYYDGCPDNYRPLVGLRVNNCTFSHIYYQPVGSHCEKSIFENIKSEYCVQGVDMSTCANGTIVRNCEFRDCATGFKQENSTFYQQFTHNNSIENCLYEISDAFDIINSSHYIFYANAGQENDTFRISGCNIIVNSQSGDFNKLMSCRSHCTLIENTSIDINIHSLNDSELVDPTKYDANALFTVGGGTPYNPILIVKNTRINCNAKIQYISAPYNGTQILNISFDGLQLVCNAIPLRSVAIVGSVAIDISNSNIDIITSKLFSSTNEVKLSNSYFGIINDCLYEPSSGQILKIENCHFNYVKTFLKLTSGIDQISVYNNDIICTTFADCPNVGIDSYIVVAGNRICLASQDDYLEPVEPIEYDRHYLLNSFTEPNSAPEDFSPIIAFDNFGSNAASIFNTSHFVIQNNYFISNCSSLRVQPLPENKQTTLAHLLYKNVFAGTFTQLANGVLSQRPSIAEDGMIYSVTEGAKYLYPSNGWIQLSSTINNDD